MSRAGGPAPPTAERLGAAIRTLRTDRELTAEQLASTAGIHWTYLSGIERGIRNPSWRVLVGIAGGLGVRVSELIRMAEADEPGSLKSAADAFRPPARPDRL
jgi:transcriptional regulator with XRE-family HTH domain